MKDGFERSFSYSHLQNMMPLTFNYVFVSGVDTKSDFKTHFLCKTTERSLKKSAKKTL